MQIPIKYIAKFINGSSFKTSEWGERGLPIIRIEQLNGKPLQNYYEGNISDLVKIEKGELLFSWSATIDSYIWNKGDALLNQHIFKVIPTNKVLKKYLYYLIKHYSPIWAEQDAHGSTLKHIKKESLSKKVYLPNLIKQEEIVNFLDSKLQQIKNAVQKKRKLITLIESEWQASLASIVNGSSSMHKGDKESSEIFWAPFVPIDWTITKLGVIGKIKNGISISGDSFYSGYPFVSYLDISNNYAVPSKVDGLVESSIGDRENFSVKKGDVFFTRTSEIIEEIGLSSVCLKEIQDAVYAGFLLRFRPLDDTLYPLYSKYLFRNQNLRSYFYKEMMIVTRASLSQGLLKNMPLVIPPFNDQIRIANYLEEKNNKINLLKNKINKSIDLLESYKDSLISNLVTGKLDVSMYRNILN